MQALRRTVCSRSFIHRAHTRGANAAAKGTRHVASAALRQSRARKPFAATSSRSQLAAHHVTRYKQMAG